MKRWIFFLPLLGFLGLGAYLWDGLYLNPHRVPTVLKGQEVPPFDLPPLEGRDAIGFSNAGLKGEVSLVNVFASWCTACRAEHPLFMEMRANGTVSIHGFNYKDKPADAAAWLDELGDPYTLTGADINGRVGIEWGVYGVPETFVITRDGMVAYKHIGPISRQVLDDMLLPLIERLRTQEPTALTTGSSANGEAR